jgi:hypothetical protein
MGQQRALEGDQLDVPVVQERRTMLRLSVRCLAIRYDGDAPTQRLGGAVLRKRMV